MARYKLTLTNVILDTEKGLDFPANAGNRHFQEYSRWVEAGGVADAADLPAPPDAPQLARTGARTWFEANSNAQALFTLSVDELAAEIDGLDLAVLPTATRNKLKLLLKTLAVLVRVLAKRELS